MNKYYQQVSSTITQFAEGAKATMDDMKPICLMFSRFTKDMVKAFEEGINSCWENGNEVMKFLLRLHDELSETICSGDIILTRYDKFNGE